VQGKVTAERAGALGVLDGERAGVAGPAVGRGGSRRLAGEKVGAAGKNSGSHCGRCAGRSYGKSVQRAGTGPAAGPEHEQYITLLPKSVTTAISMDVSRELGGIATLTGAIVILTGIVGALAAETVCKVFRITNPIAKGIGIGTASHAVGTSKALEIGEVEGAMSGLSVAVAGIMTAVLCPLFSELIH